MGSSKKISKIALPVVLLAAGVLLMMSRHRPSTRTAETDLRDALASPAMMPGALRMPPPALGGRAALPPSPRSIPAAIVKRQVIQRVPAAKPRPAKAQAASVVVQPPVVVAQPVAAVPAVAVEPPQAAAIPAPSRIAVAAAVRGQVLAFKDAAGEGRVLKSGAPLYEGDKILTDSQGGLQVLFLDETAVSIGPDGSLTLQTFSFDPATDDGKVAFRIDEGSFRFASGRVAHKKPENMKVIFPDAVLDVHGTLVAGRVGLGRLIAVLLGPGPNRDGERPGAFTLHNGAGNSNVNVPGYGTRIEGQGRPPVPPFHVSIPQLNALLGSLGQPAGTGGTGGAGGTGGTGGQVEGNSRPSGPVNRLISMLNHLLKSASDDEAKDDKEEDDKAKDDKEKNDEPEDDGGAGGDDSAGDDDGVDIPTAEEREQAKVDADDRALAKAEDNADSAMSDLKGEMKSLGLKPGKDPLANAKEALEDHPRRYASLESLIYELELSNAKVDDAELGTRIRPTDMVKLFRDIATWRDIRAIETGRGHYQGHGAFKLTKCDGQACENPTGSMKFRLNVDFKNREVGGRSDGHDSRASFTASADNLSGGTVSDSLSIPVTRFGKLSGNALLLERSESGNFAADIALKNGGDSAQVAVRYFDGATDGHGIATAPLVCDKGSCGSAPR